MVRDLPTPSLALHPSPKTAVAAGALATAAAAGVLLAHKPALGIALVAAVIFVPLAFRQPALGLACWLVTAFLNGLPGTHGAGTNYVLLTVFLAWIGTVIGGSARLRAMARRRAWLLGFLVAFLLWVSLSLAWAQDPASAKDAVRNLWICAPILIMTMSLVTRPEHVRWLAFAYILGAVLSVLAGIADGGLHAATDISSATSDEGRLQGGTSDPNYLASAIPPAVVLAGALAMRRGRPLTRIALVVAVGILAIGLAATQSRGGLLAAGVVFVGAVVVWKGRRRTILGFFAVLAAMAAVWFASSPAAWQRVSSDSDGGSGRTDIWSVAWRMVEDRPFTGVGLGQFPIVSPQYLPQLGPISRGDLLIDEHIVVHNGYLQMWAETGIVGLLLFLAIAVASLAAARAAANRFEALGDVEMTAMARAALLAVVGSLTASFFLSNLDNRRTWLLFGLGPALLALAVRESRARLRA